MDNGRVLARPSSVGEDVYLCPVCPLPVQWGQVWHHYPHGGAALDTMMSVPSKINMMFHVSGEEDGRLSHRNHDRSLRGIISFPSCTRR